MDRPLSCDANGILQTDIASGTITLPSGAATSAKEDTGNTSLSSIDAKATACNTGAVVISSSALPSGAATDSKQDSGNTSLSSIDGKITACNTGAVTISVLPTVGSHANTSNAQTTIGTDEKSTNSIDCQYVSKIVAFGSVDQACTVTLQQSQDNSNFYSTGLTYVASTAEDFYISLSGAGARYYQLSYSASGTTVTATIAGKN